ncbi:MAG TPA: methylated-DNA--[protein]-cysteine S-methyltransferase [bacterium]
MNEQQIAYYQSPIGYLKITTSDHGISALDFWDDEAIATEKPPGDFAECFQQLDEYFSRRRQGFSLKLNPQGTDFQKRVWNELVNIPYGKTTSYLKIAETLGDRKALRAVGAANGRNPIPIIIPCHRVIGRNGDLIGFGGGIWRKEWLLRHEGVVLV